MIFILETLRESGKPPSTRDFLPRLFCPHSGLFGGKYQAIKDYCPAAGPASRAFFDGLQES
jgi:hypothetical protein